MNELMLHVPTTVLLGLDVVERIGEIAARYGRRALIVTEGVLYDEQATAVVKTALRKASVDSIVFDELGPGALTTTIERAIAIAKSSRVELVIGLGGIRSLSYAKCVARMAAVDAPFDDYFTSPGHRDSASGALPYIEAPTTCRDPFMLTDQSLIVDARNRRSQIVHVDKAPEWALLDPSLTLSLPERYTITTMMDTFLTGIEAYFSPRSTFLSDSLCLRAIGIIVSIMDELADHGEDRQLRVQASQAGLLVALSLTMSGQGVGSAIAYALGGLRMIPKSLAATVMIPHVLELEMSEQPKKVDRIGNVLGEELYGKPLREFSVKVVDAIRQRMSLLRLPMRFKDAEVGAEELGTVADIAADFEAVKEVPRRANRDVLLQLIRKAY